MTDFNVRRRQLSQKARSRDFSLVELLVGLVILGLVACLAGPRLLGHRSGSREGAAQAQIKSFVSALDLFRLDVGRYPTNGEGLDALVHKPAAADRWAGPYLKPPTVPQDPWGTAYDYHVPGKKGPYAIMAPGPDGDGGTAIGNP